MYDEVYKEEVCDICGRPVDWDYHACNCGRVVCTDECLVNCSYCRDGEACKRCGFWDEDSGEWFCGILCALYRQEEIVQKLVEKAKHTGSAEDLHEYLEEREKMMEYQRKAEKLREKGLA